MTHECNHDHHEPTEPQDTPIEEIDNLYQKEAYDRIFGSLVRAAGEASRRDWHAYLAATKESDEAAIIAAGWHEIESGVTPINARNRLLVALDLCAVFVRRNDKVYAERWRRAINALFDHGDEDKTDDDTESKRWIRALVDFYRGKPLPPPEPKTLGELVYGSIVMVKATAWQLTNDHDYDKRRLWRALPGAIENLHLLDSTPVRYLATLSDGSHLWEVGG